MKQSIGYLACVLLLSACGSEVDSAPKTAPASTPTAAAITASAPAVVAKMPQACEQMLANIEKCVAKYEKDAASDAVAFRMEFEQLKSQITTNTDAQGLAQACSESNRQTQQMPEMQC